MVSWHERALLAEAVCGLASARIALAVFPFRRIARRIGTLVPAGDARIAEAGAAGTPEQARIAREIGWAVTRAAGNVPFRAVCLPQAMAAHAMLRRRGITGTMHLGARPGTEAAIDAHAWLDAAGVEVTGYPLAPDQGELGAFV